MLFKLRNQRSECCARVYLPDKMNFFFLRTQLVLATSHYAPQPEKKTPWNASSKDE